MLNSLLCEGWDESPWKLTFCMSSVCVCVSKLLVRMWSINDMMTYAFFRCKESFIYSYSHEFAWKCYGLLWKWFLAIDVSKLMKLLVKVLFLMMDLMYLIGVTTINFLSVQLYIDLVAEKCNFDCKKWCAEPVFFSHLKSNCRR